MAETEPEGLKERVETLLDQGRLVEASWLLERSEEWPQATLAAYLAGAELVGRLLTQVVCQNQTKKADTVDALEAILSTLSHELNRPEIAPVNRISVNVLFDEPGGKILS